MSVREMKAVGKISWIFLLVSMLVIEFHAIDKDRSDNDDKQAKFFALQQTGFSSIASGVQTSIDNSQKQFDISMKETEKVFGKTQEAADSVTGGDSFAYIEFPQNLETAARVVKIGKAPLYALKAYISFETVCPPFPCRNQAGFVGKNLDTLPMGSESPDYSQHSFALQEIIPANFYASQGERVFMRVDLSARNGDWREFYWLYRPKPGYFQHGFRIYKMEYDKQGVPRGSKFLRQHIDSCLPMEMLGSDDLAPKHSPAGKFYDFWDGKFMVARASHPCSQVKQP